MEGSFTSGRFCFQVEFIGAWESNLRGLREDLEDDSFDLRLVNTGKLPDLAGAPVASWLLARLTRLTDSNLVEGVENNDGGGYAVEFGAYLVSNEIQDQQAAFIQPLLFDLVELGVHIKPPMLIASFHFQGNMDGAAVFGQRDPDYATEDLLNALASALLAAPTELMNCKVAVRDPEWKHDPEMYAPRPVKKSRNWYGWDGFQFLGKDNIREISETDSAVS